MAATRRLAGIRQLVVTKMVGNDNDVNRGTSTGRVKGGFLYSYFVRWVYVFRYPTAYSHPCKLTSKMLASSDVENIILSGRYATTPLGTYNVVLPRVGSCGVLSLGGGGQGLRVFVAVGRAQQTQQRN